MPISVVIVDDHPLMRKAINATIKESSMNLKVVGEGATEEEAVSLIENRKPDIVLLDISMRVNQFNEKPANIFEIIQSSRRKSKETKIICISAVDQPSTIQRVLEEGANGYLLKTDNLSLNIPQAIQITILGGTFLSEGVPKLLINTLNGVDDLTHQQKRILQAIFDNPDKSLEQIAEKLFMSVNTLRVHLARARDKLDAISTITALVKAIRLGIVSI